MSETAKEQTADVPDRKVGKWKRDNQYTIRCPECGKVYWENIAKWYKYCPNCGQPVDGGE